MKTIRLIAITATACFRRRPRSQSVDAHGPVCGCAFRISTLSYIKVDPRLGIRVAARHLIASRSVNKLNHVGSLQ